LHPNEKYQRPGQSRLNPRDQIRWLLPLILNALIRLLAAPCLRRRSARSQRSCLDQRHNQSDSGVGCTSDNRGFSLGRRSRLHDPRSGSNLWRGRHTPIARHGHSGQAYRTGLTLAERLCRTVDRIDPARVCGPHHCLGRGASASGSEILWRLLQQGQNTPIIEQRCAGLSPNSANRKHQITRHHWRTSSSLRPGLGFRLAIFHYDQFHREWEMAPDTQRKSALGVAVAAALVVLVNLVGGAGPNVWDQLRPDGVAHRLAIVRF
jgi:hypothetical protein